MKRKYIVGLAGGVLLAVLCRVVVKKSGVSSQVTGLSSQGRVESGKWTGISSQVTECNEQLFI